MTTQCSFLLRLVMLRGKYSQDGNFMTDALNLSLISFKCCEQNMMQNMKFNFEIGYDMNQKAGNFQGHNNGRVWFGRGSLWNNALLKIILKCTSFHFQILQWDIFNWICSALCTIWASPKEWVPLLQKLVIVSTKKQFDLQSVHF